MERIALECVLRSTGGLLSRAAPDKGDFKMRTRLRAVMLVLALALSVLCLAAVTPAALAQNGSYGRPQTHHRNIIQRHPTMTGVATGMATHHALKVSARRKKARGAKLNWAERHPTLTSVGVGAATRHAVKNHTR